jgi:hypothetical protein
MKRTLFMSALCLFVFLVVLGSTKLVSVSARESTEGSASGQNEERGKEQEQNQERQEQGQERQRERQEREREAEQQRKLNRDNLAEFRNKQNEEFAAKRKELREQRKACEVQLQTLRKDRAAQRKTKVSECAIPKPPEPFATDEERKAWWDEQRAKRKACFEAVKQFEKETRAEILSTRQACFNQERTVLGLSTEVPSGQ